MFVFLRRRRQHALHLRVHENAPRSIFLLRSVSTRRRHRGGVRLGYARCDSANAPLAISTPSAVMTRGETVAAADRHPPPAHDVQSTFVLPRARCAQYCARPREATTDPARGTPTTSSGCRAPRVGHRLGRHGAQSDRSETGGDLRVGGIRGGASTGGRVERDVNQVEDAQPDDAVGEGLGVVGKGGGTRRGRRQRVLRAQSSVCGKRRGTEKAARGTPERGGGVGGGRERAIGGGVFLGVVSRGSRDARGCRTARRERRSELRGSSLPARLNRPKRRRVGAGKAATRARPARGRRGRCSVGGARTTRRGRFGGSGRRGTGGVMGRALRHAPATAAMIGDGESRARRIGGGRGADRADDDRRGATRAARAGDRPERRDGRGGEGKVGYRGGSGVASRRRARENVTRSGRRGRHVTLRNYSEPHITRISWIETRGRSDGRGDSSLLTAEPEPPPPGQLLTPRTPRVWSDRRWACCTLRSD